MMTESMAAALKRLELCILNEENRGRCADVVMVRDKSLVYGYEQIAFASAAPEMVRTRMGAGERGAEE